MDTVQTKSWEDFLHKIRDYQNQCGFPSPSNNGVWLYRGQENSAWSLETTLERSQFPMSLRDYYKIARGIQPEVQSSTGMDMERLPHDSDTILLEYQKLGDAIRVGEFPGHSYFAYLRQHGFPSPLLDWSRSLYVAAFFAFDGIKTNEYASIYSLSFLNPQVTNSAKPKIHRLGHKIMTHRRHFLQQSEYTISLKFAGGWHFERHDVAFNTQIDKEFGNYDLIKFDIPKSEAQKVLSDLDEHNLNALSLFGSDEALVKTLAFRNFR